MKHKNGEKNYIKSPVENQHALQQCTNHSKKRNERLFLIVSFHTCIKSENTNDLISSLKTNLQLEGCFIVTYVEGAAVKY